MHVITEFLSCLTVFQDAFDEAEEIKQEELNIEENPTESQGNLNHNVRFFIIQGLLY